jgi:hypothetical protein
MSRFVGQSGILHEKPKQENRKSGVESHAGVKSPAGGLLPEFAHGLNQAGLKGGELFLFSHPDLIPILMGAT